VLVSVIAVSAVAAWSPPAAAAASKLIWSSPFLGTYANPIQQLPAIVVGPTCIYVAGGQGPTASAESFFLARYSLTGRLQWIRRESALIPKSCELGTDAKGNAYILVNSLLIKYSSAGRRQWIRIPRDAESLSVDGRGDCWVTTTRGVYTFGSGGRRLSYVAIPGVVALDGTHNIYALGNALSGAAIAKYDPSGHQLWQQPIPSTTVPSPVVALGNGRVYVADVLWLGPPTNEDSWSVTCFSASGSQEYSVTLFPSSNEGEDYGPYGVVVDGEGEAFVCGQYGTGDTGYDLVRLSASGQVVWVTPTSDLSARDYEAGGHPTLALPSTADIFVGVPEGAPGGPYPETLMKYSSSGVLEWTRWTNSVTDYSLKGGYLYVFCLKKRYNLFGSSYEAGRLMKYTQ
jgi:hypothetical protein